MIEERLPPYLELDGKIVVTKNILKDVYGIVTQNAIMHNVIDDAIKIAQTNSPVMLVGESGTGKELIAKLIYNVSKRAGGPFISVNCASFTDTLLESELFGHVKGAFTGAVSARDGVFAAADRGTLFLDEVSEMSPDLQAKILRAIQHGTFSKVGSYQETRADIRFIAATNKKLMDLVRQGRFREDLYYRLNVVQIALPPLRTRLDDVGCLVEFFLKRFGEINGKNYEIEPETLEALRDNLWPGNVRELENAIERATIMCEDDIISLFDLPTSIYLRTDESSCSIGDLYIGLPLSEALDNMKKDLIIGNLIAYNGSVKNTAKSLKIQRTYLSRLLSKFNIDRLSLIDGR